MIEKLPPFFLIIADHDREFFCVEGRPRSCVNPLRMMVGMTVRIIMNIGWLPWNDCAWPKV